jgi:CIC family chloride channel protein
MVHGGAALGSWLGAKFRLDDYHVKLLLACGAAGGLAAAYKAPIGASIFAMEILLGTLAMEIFGPIIICSVLSTTIAYVVFGSQPVYEVFHYQISSPWEVFLDLGLGVILGFVSVLCIKVFSRVSDLFAWLGPAARWKSIVAMGILGLVAIRFPELLGNGYDTVNDVVNGRLRPSLGLLILLPVSKILVTALCRAGGVPGGLFTPSLFIGALLGCAYGVVANQIFPPGYVSNPGAYALVGMGAIVAGTLQAPITAIIMIFELTRDYQSILPLMSACVASALVSHFLGVGSLYTEPLRRRGIHLPTAIAPPWIRQPTVRSVLNTVVATVGPADRFQQVVDRFLKTPEGQDHLYVTREDGTCSGVISLHDIKRFIRSSEHLDGVIADDILTESFPYVYADDPLSRAIEIFSQHSFERLPVLDDPESRRLLGTVSKRKILAAYSESNLARQRVRAVVPVFAEKEGTGDP